MRLEDLVVALDGMLEDFRPIGQADCVATWGSRGGHTSPRIVTAMTEARGARTELISHIGTPTGGDDPQTGKHRRVPTAVRSR